MANYCANSIIFYAKRKKPLEEIRQMVSRCLSDAKLNSVKQFLIFADLKRLADGEFCDGRDYFVNCDAEVEKDIGLYCLRVETESAWSPNMIVIELMLKAKYNGTVKMVYESEEVGSDVYVNTDKLGLYFVDRYKVEFNYKDDTDSEYFTDWRSTVKYLHEKFPLAKLCLAEELETAEKKIRKAYKFSEADCDYININEFEECEDDRKIWRVTA